MSDNWPVRILGIDPGSQRTGIGLVEADRGGKVRYVYHQTIHLRAETAFVDRLKQIYEQVSALIEEHRPDEAAIERVFASRNNADSVLKLGQARGAAIVAVAGRGVPIAEYAAKAVKLAVVGTGGADKRQVQHMVGVLLGQREAIQIDAADALAIALTHAHSRSARARIEVAALSWRIR